MTIKNTLFPYLRSYLDAHFQKDDAKSILQEIENRFSSMQSEADYRGNKQIKWHMEKNLLPGIAIYLSLLGYYGNSDDALKATDDIFQIARLKNQRKNQLVGRLPFGFPLFRLFSRPIISRQYPEAGWKKTWQMSNTDEIYFDMNTCLYLETTEQYGCPELCPLFCANDDVVLAGFKPAIVFDRQGTLANGDKTCDFHFKRGSRS